jgi:hypothetical protein
MGRPLRLVAPGCVLAVVLAGPRGIAVADGAEIWLDRPLAAWNTAGMPIPPVQGIPNNDPQCSATTRPAATPEDHAVAGAGWILDGPYRAGWGILVVAARSNSDGMCRPLDYQNFVFVDGAFAGTISPIPMSSRSDGAGYVTGFDASGRLAASFVRYAPTDPLCCASGPATFLDYRIDRTPAGPVLIPVSRYP